MHKETEKNRQENFVKGHPSAAKVHNFSENTNANRFRLIFPCRIKHPGLGVAKYVSAVIYNVTSIFYGFSSK